MLAQDFHHFLRHLPALPIHAEGKLANKVIHQKRDVLRTRSQGRKIDREYIQPVKEIGAKPPFAHHLRQVLIGGRDDTNVNASGACAAEPLELLFLENTQELGLQFERQVADFVEKQRSCVGHVGGGEKGYQNGGGVVPCWVAVLSEPFPLIRKPLFRTARSRQGRAVVGRGEANP